MEEAIYDGAGNLFRMIDGRGSGISPSAFEGELARRLCLLQGGSKADGIILLSGAEAPGCDFSMHYFNNDGTGGMMCGNGGRCAIAFARDCGFALTGWTDLLLLAASIVEAFSRTAPWTRS